MKIRIFQVVVRVRSAHGLRQVIRWKIVVMSEMNEIPEFSPRLHSRVNSMDDGSHCGNVCSCRSSR